MMPSTDRSPRITVWDLPTRLFHWLLVALLATNLLLADDKGLVFRLHASIGYAILGLVLFRIGWGVIGGEHARFADFVRPWSEVRDYLKDVLDMAPPRHIGHNPAGGWMIVAILILLLLIVATGMMGAVSTGATIPLFSWVPRGASRAIRELHEVLGNILIGVIVLHVLGVLVEWLLSGDNLIRAMIDGTKQAAPWRQGEPHLHDAWTVGLWRAVLLAILAGAVALWLLLTTVF